MCTFCEQLKPAYDKISEEFNNNEDSDIEFATVNGDLPEINQITKALGVHAYPTIIYFKPGTLQVENVFEETPRSYENLKRWAVQTRELIS